MNIKLNEVPFSTAGSYIALGWLEDDFHRWGNKKGLYIRTVHGKSGNTIGCSSLIARIVPEYQGKEIPCEVSATPDHMLMNTDKGFVKIVFDDEATVLMQGHGEGLSLKLDFSPFDGNRTFNMIEQWQAGEREWYMANMYRNSGRYMLHCQKGIGTITQNWNGESTDKSEFTVDSQAGEFLLVFEEVIDSWKDSGKKYNVEQAQQKMQEAFTEFCKKMPSVPEEFAETGEYASYVNWSSIIAPCGLFKRYAMYMSKNWMSSVWSWDHCFNAIAAAYGDPEMAWDQFMVMFDHQRPSGMIPDSINDVFLVDGYCKPPIHGWTYNKLKKIFTPTYEMKQEAYEKIGKWTEWWFAYRDPNGDGICDYTHGNDSGWDNSTAFIEEPPMALPDLSAFLILQMEELSALAEELGKAEESKLWKERADILCQKILNILFRDGEPQAVHTFTGKAVETKSLILCLPIVLGKRLPDEVREKIMQRLRLCQTEWGYATEQPDSQLYISDGYWRGPIWAPSTMLIVDGLESCGEHELAVEISRKFCEMVDRSGCAENFDALTGEGLRDRAYTWTASVMLILAHEYLM